MEKGESAQSKQGFSDPNAEAARPVGAELVPTGGPRSSRGRSVEGILSLPARAVGAAADLGFRGLAGVSRFLGADRVAAAAVERLLAGPIVDAVARGLIERGVVEQVARELITAGVPQRVVDQVIASEVPEQVLDRVLAEEFATRITRRALGEAGVVPAATEVLESTAVDQLSEVVLESDELAAVITKIANSDEVREAITQQSFGLITDFGGEVAVQARKLDTRVERLPRRIAHKAPRKGEVEEAGVVSRGVALLLDALIVLLAFFVLSSIVSVFASFFSSTRMGFGFGAVAVGTAVYAGGAGLYLLAFWGFANQTPGMRFMRLRLEPVVEDTVSFWDALRRLVGFVLSGVFLIGCAMILFSDRRRGLLDRFGDTVVVYVPERLSSRARMSFEQREPDSA